MPRYGLGLFQRNVHLKRGGLTRLNKLTITTAQLGLQFYSAITSN